MCVSRNQRQYAERIEARLRVIGLKVDVLFPNPKVDLNKIMGNIATRGVMFAILITPLNEDHGSVTLNVLQVNDNGSILYYSSRGACNIVTIGDCNKDLYGFREIYCQLLLAV